MNRFKNRKKTSIIAMFLVLSVAGAAFAYWTAGGTGTGDVETGTTVPLQAHQTSTMIEMYPGDDPQLLSGNFDNDNDGPIRVNTVTAAITNVVKAVGAPAGACTAADYEIDAAEMTVGVDVAPGDGVGAWSGATIQMLNSLTDQNGCKDATVTITYTIA